MTPEIRDALRALRRPRNVDRPALEALARVCAPTPTGRRSAVTAPRTPRVPGPSAAVDPTRAGGK